MGLPDRVADLNPGVKFAVGIELLAAVGFVLVTTVLLVALSGPFVLSGGESVSSSPEAAFEFGQTDGVVVIEHVGGESLPVDSLVVLVDGDRAEWTGQGVGDGLVERGDSLTVTAGPDAVVELWWTGGAGEPTSLGTYMVR